MNGRNESFGEADHQPQLKFIQRSSGKKSESARDPLASVNKSHGSSAANNNRVSAHGHTGSFLQQKRCSDIERGSLHPAMLNQFSFGHLQSSEKQPCASSEHCVKREIESMMEGTDSASGLAPQIFNIDSQMAMSEQAAEHEKL